MQFVSRKQIARIWDREGTNCSHKQGNYALQRMWKVESRITLIYILRLNMFLKLLNF